jgi:hypothetical protein
MGQFRTKRGACSIANGELRVDESYRSQLKRYYEGARSSIRGFVLVVGAFAYLLWWFTTTTLTQRWLLPYCFGAFVVVVGLAYTIDYLRGFRRPATIPLDAISEVTVVDGSVWTHRRFVVSYETDNQSRRRRIKAPSRGFAFSESEFERAKQLFRSNDVPLAGDTDRPNTGQRKFAESQ